METTLHIHRDIMATLSRAAESRSASRSSVIIMLLHRVMNEAPDRFPMGRAVRYQEQSRPDEWRVFHIDLREEDYEFFLDLRKVLKMSVSLILAYAVRRYLKDPESPITDNYLFRDYVAIKSTMGGTICWTLIWHRPPDIPARR